MHIITMLGSPRKKGNTAAVLRRFETLAVGCGQVVTHVDIVDKNLGGCLGCDCCQANLNEPGCVQNDDADELLRQIIDADLVVYAAPVYCWSVPAQMKALIDRHYCTVKWEGGEVAARLLAGKRSALLLTCGGDAATNADLTLPMFERQMDYTGGVVAGMFVLDNCTSPLEDADRARALAQQMADELLGEAVG